MLQELLRAVVNRYEDERLPADAPQRPDPLRRFSLQSATCVTADISRPQPRGDRPRGCYDVAIRVRTRAIAVVEVRNSLSFFEALKKSISVRRGIPVNYDGKPIDSLRRLRASALYDNCAGGAPAVLQPATFETEPIPSLSSDGRLAIEPTGDPSVLSVRWFGSRHILHVPKRRPFTDHEVRFARAIGAVLAMRYRAIFDPRQMLERQDLFRGAIEDRYIGAFLDATPYSDQSQTRADLIANAIGSPRRGRSRATRTSDLVGCVARRGRGSA